MYCIIIVKSASVSATTLATLSYKVLVIVIFRCGRDTGRDCSSAHSHCQWSVRRPTKRNSWNRVDRLIDQSMKPASQAERDARGYHLLSLDPLQGLYQEKDDPPGLPKWPQPVNGPPRFECMKDRDRIPLVVCITAYNEPWAHKPPRTGEFAASTSHVKESGTIRATLSGVVGNVAALQQVRNIPAHHALPHTGWSFSAQVRDRMHLPHDVRRRAPPLTVRHTSRMFPESVSSRFSRALSSRFGRSMPSHGRRGNDSASPASSQGTPAGAARARPSNVPPLPATSFTASGAAPPTDGTVAFENSARKPGAHVDPSSFDEEK